MNSHAAAAGGAAGQVSSTGSQNGTDLAGIDNIAMRLHLGTFDPAPNKGKLTGGDKDFAVGFSGSIYFDDPGYLALDGEYLIQYRKYDTNITGPLALALDDKMYLTTDGILLGLRAYQPLSENRKTFRVYGSMGFGVFQNKLVVDGNSAELIDDLSDYNLSAGLYGGAGFEFNGERLALSLDYRYLKHKGDFPNFDLKNVDLGGDFLSFGVGIIF